MTRHGRNATASMVYSYHEKKKDTSQGGYGSLQARLSKDSVKDFDCCCLSLQPCRDAMITPDGYVYDKESILEYFVSKKAEFARKMKEHEKQKNKHGQELKELAEAETRAQAEKFVSQEASILSKDPFMRHAQPSSSTATASASVSNMKDGKHKQLPSFWVPTQTPDNKETIIKKPDKTIYCPMSGKPLRMKDLVSFQFTRVKDKDDKRADIIKDARYMCAVTHDLLTNSIPCAVLKTSGSVVTMECVEKLIKKDFLDPINGKQLKESDIIPIKGGTGFAASGAQLSAVKATPVMQ